MVSCSSLSERNGEHKALPIAGIAFLPASFVPLLPTSLLCYSPPLTLWCHFSLQQTKAFVGSSASSRVSAVPIPSDHQPSVISDILSFTCHYNRLCIYALKAACNFPSLPVIFHHSL